MDEQKSVGNGGKLWETLGRSRTERESAKNSWNQQESALNRWKEFIHLQYRPLEFSQILRLRIFGWGCSYLRTEFGILRPGCAKNDGANYAAQSSARPTGATCEPNISHATGINQPTHTSSFIPDKFWFPDKNWSRYTSVNLKSEGVLQVSSSKKPSFS